MDAYGLSLDDPAWTSLHGGYRMPYDPRPILRALEAGAASGDDWTELITNLYHQQDVGDATYATVPHLVRIYASRRVGAAETFSFIAMVELARCNGLNPPVPENLSKAYKAAFAELTSIGLREFILTDDPAVASLIIALAALHKGQVKLAQFAALC